jgi:hypothetical protein
MESNNDVNSIQLEGGPGRGLFQYERQTDTTEQGAAETAYNHAIDAGLDPNTPWLVDLKAANYDVVEAKLTAQQQTDLFVLDQLRARNRMAFDSTVEQPKKARGFTATTNAIMNSTSADNTSREAYEYWRDYHKKVFNPIYEYVKNAAGETVKKLDANNNPIVLQTAEQLEEEADERWIKDKILGQVGSAMYGPVAGETGSEGLHEYIQLMKTGEYDVQPPSLNEWLRKPGNPDAPVDAAPVDAAPVDGGYQDALNIGGEPTPAPVPVPELELELEPELESLVTRPPGGAPWRQLTTP